MHRLRRHRRRVRLLGSSTAAMVCALVLSGCGSTTLGGKQQQHPVLLSAPVSVGEGNTGKPALNDDPERPASEDQESLAGTLPDPEPLSTTAQWEYELRFNHGEITVTNVTPRRFDKPVTTARRVGRFAFELWIGRELVERVRFDFPLLGVEKPVGPRQDLHEAPRFAPGLDATRTILVPASPRATRALIQDRATLVVTALPWPPDAPLSPPDEHAPTSAPHPDVPQPDAPRSGDSATEPTTRE